ncbi:MAG: MAPEG family protein [Halieaceae bacterium]
MQTETAILAPAAVLAGWSMIVFLWLLARRLPAFKAAGVVLSEMPAGARGADGEAQMPAKANWISHNYTHLMEQPTVFYPVVIMLAQMGETSALSINLAWGYAALRILHSFWQANVNTIPIRFALFGSASACLIALAARAVLLAL